MSIRPVNEMTAAVPPNGRLAIVGSVMRTATVADREAVRRIIVAALDRFRPSVVISGGAEGVDTMAALEARRRGITVVEHRPAAPRWHDGYRPRNLRIAEDCDVLVRIAWRGSRTYGSGWMRDRAAELGKHTEEYVV